MENILNKRYQELTAQRQQLLTQLNEINGRIAELQELYNQIAAPQVNENGREEPQPEPAAVEVE